MGYYRDGSGSATLKPGTDLLVVLASLKATMLEPEYLAKHARGGSSPARGEVFDHKWYSWTNSRELLAARTLEAFIKKFFEYLEFSSDGSRFDFSDNNKIGQEDLLFKHLAPFLMDGEHIAEWRGEDGNHWAWSIRDGVLFELQGHVVYER